MFYGVDGGEIAGQVLLLSRCDILLCGVGAAYIHRRFVLDQMTLRLIPLGAVAVMLVGAIHFRLTGSGVFHVIGPLLAAIIFASYVSLAARSSEILRLFRAARWQFFGSISYGLYLIHQPVAGVMHGLILGGRPDIGSLPQLAVTMAGLGTSIGLAWASWRFLEGPLVRLGQGLAI